MGNSNAKAGDVVELADKEIGFTDPDSGLDISRDQKMELKDPIGSRTHEALMSGGLLIVRGKSAKAEAAADAKDEEKATDDAAKAASTKTTVVEVHTKPSTKKK